MSTTLEISLCTHLSNQQNGAEICCDTDPPVGWGVLSYKWSEWVWNEDTMEGGGWRLFLLTACEWFYLLHLLWLLPFLLPSLRCQLMRDRQSTGLVPCLPAFLPVWRQSAATCIGTWGRKPVGRAKPVVLLPFSTLLSLHAGGRGTAVRPN